jgi:hypothetical protein
MEQRWGEAQPQKPEQKIELLLEEAQANAVPYEEAQAIQAKITLLKSEEGDHHEDSAALQSILAKSIITIKDLPEFTTLLEKVAFSHEHIEQLLNHPLPEGDHHEAYCLLVSKEGNEYRYNAWEVSSRLKTVEPIQKSLPSPDDQKRIKQLESEVRQSIDK